MLLENAYLTEFLAEANFIFARIDYGNRFTDLLTPIKQHFLNQKDILCFSLTRFCGGNSKLGFFCEWFYNNLVIQSSTEILVEENRKYFRKKVPLQFRGVPNLYQTLESKIGQTFLPQQLQILNSSSTILSQELKHQYPYLAKYLDESFLSQILASEFAHQSLIFNENIILSQILELQSTRLAFAQVALPCLIGFLYNFSQPENPINPTQIKWSVIETILKATAFLLQTSKDTPEIIEIIHISTLSDKEKFLWWSIPKDKKQVELISKAHLYAQLSEIRQKVYNNGLNDLNSLILPDKYKEILKDLLDWGFGSVVLSSNSV